MSIAAITSSFVTAVRERPVAASSTPAEPVADVQGAIQSGRRHELVDAMQQVLGSDSIEGKSGEQVVFRFAHALMHDLRKIDTDAEGPTPGGGRAWGRRSYSDLSQRLETLATASSASANPAAPATPVTPVTPTKTATSATSATTSTPLTVELPPPPAVDTTVQPDPLTATSAALHLMQVPSSRLLEAYAALRQALGDGEAEPSPAVAATPADVSTPAPDANRSALADFLTRLSTTLSADTPASLPAGSLVNVHA